MKRLIKTNIEISDIECIAFCSVSYRDKIVSSITSSKESILSSISSKDITKSMVRVKSSNVWSYTINIRDRKDKVGDVYVQFKNKNGGKGDVYVYYSIPIVTYRKFVSSASKGHAIWQYLRDNPNGYSKLTGDKRGKLRNAINH